MSRCMLTTVDNPYNYFEQFIDWYMFDTQNNYDSCGKIGRIAMTSDELADAENDEEIERAIDQFIKYDFTNTYTKVFEKKVS